MYKCNSISLLKNILERCIIAQRRQDNIGGILVNVFYNVHKSLQNVIKVINIRTRMTSNKTCKDIKGHSVIYSNVMSCGYKHSK